MTTPPAGRIALVTRAPDRPAAAAAGDLRGLRDRGWDAELVASAASRRRGARIGAGRALARAAVRDPRATWRSFGGATDGTSAWTRREAVGRLVALRPRVVHFDSARLAAGWLPVAGALDRPVVVGVTADDLYASGSAPFDGCAEVWTHAAAVHLPDPALERRALERGCPANLPRAIVPLALDPGRFTPGPEPTAPAREGALRVVSAGALDWKQGLEHAIHAVRLLRDAGIECEYTIVGDGEHLPALTFARHQLGVADAVEFAGPLPAEALGERLRSADVYLSAAVVDGVTHATLQALACGTPTVMSDPGPLGDDAVDERAAVVVPRRDPGALADGLATLARDAGRRRDMGRAARAWAVEHAAPERRFAALDTLLRRVV
jgi:colanic acid/amylovoran biosynthesis glycosyltransferase